MSEVSTSTLDPIPMCDPTLERPQQHFEKRRSSATALSATRPCPAPPQRSPFPRQSSTDAPRLAVFGTGTGTQTLRQDIINYRKRTSPKPASFSVRVPRTLQSASLSPCAQPQGAFVQVASPRGDLVLTTSFSRECASDKPPIRPAEVKAEVKAAWQSGQCPGKFNGLFAQR